MNTNNADKTSSWKNWIIKKLLSNDSTKEDILNFIANDEDDKDLEDLNDNNEKNLIKNIVNLNEKSVEDIMVPRAEIISVSNNQFEIDTSYLEGMEKSDKIKELNRKMLLCAKNLQFEEAAILRDEISKIKGEQNDRL